MLSNILFVLFGGAIGATTRFVISFLPKVGGFPISTLIVNVFGSLFFGFIYNLSSYKGDNWVHYFFLAGIAATFYNIFYICF